VKTVIIPVYIMKTGGACNFALQLAKIFPAVLFGAYFWSSLHHLSVVLPSRITQKSGKKAFLTDLVIPPIVCIRFAWEIVFYRKV